MTASQLTIAWSTQMNSPQKNIVDAHVENAMQASLSSQRESYIAEGFVSAATRIDRIDRAVDVLVRNSEAISEAMNADFGCRPRQVNLMTDCVPKRHDWSPSHRPTLRS